MSDGWSTVSTKKKERRPSKPAPKPAPKQPKQAPPKPQPPKQPPPHQTPKEWLEQRYAGAPAPPARSNVKNRIEDGQLVVGVVSKKATTGRGVWIAVDHDGELECYLSSQLSPTLPALHERVVFRAALHSTPHHRDGALWVARDGAWLREDAAYAAKQRKYLEGNRRTRGMTAHGVLTAIAPSRNRSIGGRDAWIALGDLDRHVYCHEAWLAPRQLPALGARVELVLDIDAATSKGDRPRWRVAIDERTGDAAIKVLNDDSACVLPGWASESQLRRKPAPRPWRTYFDTPPKPPTSPPTVPLQTTSSLHPEVTKLLDRLGLTAACGETLRQGEVLDLGTLKLCSERDLTDMGLRPAHAGRIVAALRPPAPPAPAPAPPPPPPPPGLAPPAQDAFFLGGGLRSLLDDAPPVQPPPRSLGLSGELPADFGALLPGLGALGLNATPQPQRSALAELRDGDDGAVLPLAAPSSLSAPRVNGGALPPPEPKPRAGSFAAAAAAPSPPKWAAPAPAPQKPPQKQPEDPLMRDLEQFISDHKLDASCAHELRHADREISRQALATCDMSKARNPSAFALVWWAHHGAEVRGPSGKSAKPTAAMIARGPAPAVPVESSGRSRGRRGGGRRK